MSAAKAVAGVPQREHRPSGLSHSRVSRYLHCPEQYRLYYVERLRPRHPPANLVFGQVIHQALAALFTTGEEAVGHFLKAWGPVQEMTLGYSKRESWEGLREAGQALLERFAQEALPRIGKVVAVEQRFELAVTDLDLPFVGIVDLVASVDGRKTLVDFKTATSRYGRHEIEMSDQLTAYQLAEPDAEQIAFCVLVKTKTPKVEWHVGRRSGERLAEYLERARLVSGHLRERTFYKRPGMWCSWCDYLPVCTGDRRAAEATLIQLR